MKKIEMFPIGTYEGPKITIKNEFRKALSKLDKFSHCLIFTKNENGIFCYGREIIKIDQKNGEIIIGNNVENSNVFVGELVDIKPYFPCEEIIDMDKDVLKYKFEKKSFVPIKFKGIPIGEYLYFNNCGNIKIKETENLTAYEIEESLNKIESDTYIRVFWWFHKFDDKKYRSNLMCNPPYSNAPKCGVFATRSPVRPNLIGSTVVKVISVDKYNHTISILGFDGFENSVILQIDSYDTVDMFKEAKSPKWVEHWTKHKVFKNNQSIDGFLEDKSPVNYENHFVAELENSDELEGEIIDDGNIIVENANIHNLKDISVRIPKEKITTIIGISGSGKSSLAFDTIYYESQKKFIDLSSSNSPIANDLKDSMVGKITGLQPSIAIEQKNLGQNPRSTVGSVSKSSDFLRLIFATIGKRVCPNCNIPVNNENVCGICGEIFFDMTPSLFNYNNPEYMCPVCKGMGEELVVDPDLIVTNKNLSILDGASPWWGNLRKHREKPNANWMRGEVLALADYMDENLEKPFNELSDEFRKQVFYGSEGIEMSLKYENSNGRSGTITRPVEGVINSLNRLLRENTLDKSSNHIEKFISNRKCSRCHGERLLEEARLVTLGNIRYPEAVALNITSLRKWCHYTYEKLEDSEKKKSKGLFIKLIEKLKRLESVGLSYLNLDRSVPSLSGGESQRLKIATQFGSGLSNILYIMDEPSKGLHPRDYKFLIESIEDLKKQKNTIIMVEHKKPFVYLSDFLLEIGPGAGHYGGKLLRSGEVNKSEWVGIEDYNYKIGGNEIETNNKITLTGAKANNLKNIDISIPLSKITCIIGVSGSGKSSLISKTLYPAILKKIGKNYEQIGEYEKITGLDTISDIHYVSQKPIGRNSRSNPGTYTGVFDLIRDFYGNLSDAKKKKLKKEHFSFNGIKGQCEECKGAGELAIPMHFMPDIYTVCPKCNGKRYKDSILEVKFNGYSIADLLELEVGELKKEFERENRIYEILDMIDKVGLSYIKLGQSSTTLSGGEAQRIKLAKELCDGKIKNNIYILDEPTTGLHDEDVKKLVYIFNELTVKGATVIIIEHNPLIIKQADYIIELGPDGGEFGGCIINEGWVEKINL